MILKYNKKNIAKIVAELQMSTVACLPTDTLYSLSCNAYNDLGVKKVFSIKNRSYSNALPIFVSNIEQARKYAEFNDLALFFAKKYWPGALTLVLPLKESNLSRFVTANLKTIAIRIPNNLAVLEIIQKLSAPITATSANVSCKKDLYSIEEIEKTFNEKVIILLEKNNVLSKVQSTILDCGSRKIKILREGMISSSSIKYNLNLFNGVTIKR